MTDYRKSLAAMIEEAGRDRIGGSSLISLFLHDFRRCGQAEQAGWLRALEEMVAGDDDELLETIAWLVMGMYANEVYADSLVGHLRARIGAYTESIDGTSERGVRLRDQLRRIDGMIAERDG